MAYKDEFEIEGLGIEKVDNGYVGCIWFRDPDHYSPKRVFFNLASVLAWVKSELEGRV